MNTELLNYFFSLDAGELTPKNLWTQKFLTGWNEYILGGKRELFSERERILLVNKTKTFFDLPINFNIDSEEFFRGNYHLVERELHQSDLFAAYISSLPRAIIFYNKYYTLQEELKHVVRIHERMHAFHHVENDLLPWIEFKNISPVYKEFLAQLFTYKCVQGTYLEKHFKTMSQMQPSIYHTWILAEKFSSNDVMDIYEEIKNSGSTIKFGLNIFADRYTTMENMNNPTHNKRQLENKIPLAASGKGITELERSINTQLSELENKNEFHNDELENILIDNNMLDDMERLWH